MTISKKLNLLIVFLLATTFCFAQKSPVKGFMKEMKKRDRSEVRKIGVGRIPIVVAKWFVDDEFKPLAKHCRKLRLLNMNSNDIAKSSDWKALNSEMDKAGYEELMMVRNGSEISIRTKGDSEKVNYLTAIIKEGEEQTLIEVKTKLTYAELDQLIATYSE